VTLVIVFIGAICDYYFGAVGAVLGVLVVIASLSKTRANTLIPSLMLIGISWVAGELLADDAGAMIGVALATALAVWFEHGAKLFAPGGRRPRMTSRENIGP